MELVVQATVYHSATVEKDIRDFFRAERKRRGLNQTEVATEGGIEQSTISKIERDAPYQPSVAIFLGAIRGLRMTASEFFTKFEQHTANAAGQIPTSFEQSQARDRVGQTPTPQTALKRAQHSATVTPPQQKSPGGVHGGGSSSVPDLGDVSRADPDLLEQIGHAFVLAAINGRRALRPDAAAQRPERPSRRRGGKKTRA